MHRTDERDLEILRVLKQNSQLSIGKISRKTGIPVATVHNRIKKMRESGIIKGYTVIVDKAKLGKKMVAYVLIKAMPRADHIAMLKEISKHASIEAGSAVTGGFDLILRARVADIDELNSIVLKYLRTFDTVAETQTMIAFESVDKENAF